MLSFSPTTPAGRPPLSIDVADLLPAGVTLQSAAVSIAVHPKSAEADATPAARLDGAASVAGSVVTQWFKTGVENVDYVIQFLATFSDGQIEPVDVLLPVRRFMTK